MRRHLAGISGVCFFWRGARLRARTYQLADCSWLASALDWAWRNRLRGRAGSRVFCPPTRRATTHGKTGFTSLLALLCATHARREDDRQGQQHSSPAEHIKGSPRLGAATSLRSRSFDSIAWHSVLHCGVRSAWGTR